MKTLFLVEDKLPFELEFEDNLNNLQALVGGHIEVLSIHTEGYRSIDLIFNEEGKFLFDSSNLLLVYDGKVVDDIRGNVIIVGANENTGDFESLTDEEIKKYMEMFNDNNIVHLG